MSSFFAGLARFNVKFRYIIVILWIAGTIAAVHFFPSINSVAKSNNSDFLPQNSPSTLAANLDSAFEQKGVIRINVVLKKDSGQINRSDTTAIKSVVTSLKAVQTVVMVVDLGTSPNGTVEQLLVLSNVSQAGNSDTPDVNLITSIEKTLSHTPSAFKGYVAGQIATQVASQNSSGNTGKQIQQFSILFIIVLLLLIFRSVLAPFVTIIPAIIVVTLSGPVIAEASKFGLQVSSISSFMLIVLVLGAGTDYGLFLVFREREEIRNGLPPKEAIVKALSRVGESISFSAFTVIAALLSLLLATFGIYQSMGAPLAIGIFFMLLAGLTLLPAILAILGRAVFWPMRIEQGQKREGLWGRIAARIIRRPAITLGTGLIIFLLLALGSFGNQPSGFGGQTTAPKGTSAAIGNALIAANFPNSSSNPTLVVMKFKNSVWSAPNVLQTAETSLVSNNLFSSVAGPLDPNGATISPTEINSLYLKLGNPDILPPAPPTTLKIPKSQYFAYRATREFISPDGHTIQFETNLSAGDATSTAAINDVPQIRSAVTNIATKAGAVASGVAGEAPAIYDISSVSNSDLIHVMPVAVFVIALLLMFVLRSLVAPIYLILSVVLSYFAALGLSVIVFIYFAGDGGLTFILPFLMFLFLLALGEDYNILVMTRIREEAHGLTLKEAVAKAISTTGTTVTSAGLVLAGTFAVLAIAGSQSGSSQVRDIGFGLAMGILMDAFFVRTLLVPSTVVLLDRWNWWPSKLKDIKHD